MNAEVHVVDTASFIPAYVRLWQSGELQRRAERAVARLADCDLCPRNCHADRVAGKACACRTGRYAVVSSHFAHFGEEDCLRGAFGSGTIFFGWCNLRCVFCQNYDTSWLGSGKPSTPEEIAGMMLELQEQGCHNINLVTPEHVVPQVLEALVAATARGLRLPLVYNTSAYDSLDSLEFMDGVVDIYMPDFKFWDSMTSKRFIKAPDYPEAARRAIKEMHRQVGPLVLDEGGMARRGLIVRHLVMPGEIAGTREIMQWIARELGSDTYVNIMAQYYPAGRVLLGEYAEINRHISDAEFHQALAAARGAGLCRLDARSAARAKQLPHQFVRLPETV